MNPCLPDWHIEAELPVPLQKKPLRADQELVELLWQNGQVVLHSQAHRKPSTSSHHPLESRQVHKHDQSTSRASGCSSGHPASLTQDEETASWIHCPVDEAFEKEFYSHFWSDLPLCNPVVEPNKPIRQSSEDHKFVNHPEVNHALPSSQRSGFSSNPLPPPRFQSLGLAQQQHHPHNSGDKGTGGNLDLLAGAHDLRSSNGHYGGGKGSAGTTQVDLRECSAMTVGSSYCGSNQVPNEAAMSRASSCNLSKRNLSSGPVINEYVRNISPQSETQEIETLETAITSSSGGSGSSFGRTCNQSTTTNGQKRKNRDAEDSECQSEAAELESAGGRKSTQKSGSTRRTRAAEVHNLSERRRRDRINEKMRALQELIPHSNKADKASMLDEAIEYLKSLQLQLQMMWMGSGMAPMMFPGIQQYMSRMGMGMGMAPPTIPSIPNPMQMPLLPLVDQPIAMPPPNQASLCQTSVLSPVNYQTQVQNPNFSEQYASLMGFRPLQNASQPISFFSFGSHTPQQNQMLMPPGTGHGPTG